MAAFWLNRSEIGGFTRRSHGERSSSSSPASREGTRQAQKYKSFSNFVPDSGSCKSVSSTEEKVISQLETRSHHIAGTPIKSLLAHEMAKENESKRRAPSIVARLMGLDGLPLQNHGHARRHSADSCQVRRKPGDQAQADWTFKDHHSFRTIREEQEFKDVFEVSEKMNLGSNNDQWHQNLTETEMAFIEQKFMDAKRLSTNEKLQRSKEFYDALEALDSNKELLLRFLQHPDSLFTKHLHDLQNAIPQMRCSPGPSAKSSRGSKPQNTVIIHKSNKEVQQRKIGRPSRKEHVGVRGHSRSRQEKRDARHSVEILDNDLEAKRMLQPTRIVVLKPNMVNTQVSDGCLTSPLADDHRADSRLPCSRKRDSVMWSKNKFLGDVNLARHNSRESRKMAKKVTSKMRTRYNNTSVNHPIHGFRGYAGDESSSDLSESDSVSEMELTAVTSLPRNCSRKDGLCLSSSESSVTREAKKRLSERWNMTHKTEAVGKAFRSSTLAEMLSNSDREGRPANFNGDIFEDGFGRKFEDFLAESTEPLGISSRDGWKNGHLAKSRSLPASIAVGDAHDAIRKRNPHEDWTMMPSKPVRERLLPRNFITNGTAPQASCGIQIDSSSTSQGLFGPNPKRHIFCKDSSFVDDGITSVLPAIPVSAYSGSKNVMNTEQDSVAIILESSQFDLSTPALSSGNSSSNEQCTLKSQEISSDQSKGAAHPPVFGEQSAASTKESDQPSPVSVLEPSFPDDISSGSECFESLSADLQGLRMQLRLLKLETGSYEGAVMHASSDEDADNEGWIKLKGVESGWKSSYLVDVLAKAKFSDADPDMFMATWHSSECPVSPTVFEELEQNFSNLTSVSRSKRKFLFDSINSELLRLFQQFSDPHPWVRPTNVSPKWDLGKLQSTLHKLIATEDASCGTRDSIEQVLKTESQWLKLENDIDTIGKEIEALLTDELLGEIIAM